MVAFVSGKGAESVFFFFHFFEKGHHDHMVVEFTTTYEISA